MSIRTKIDNFKKRPYSGFCQGGGVQTVMHQGDWMLQISEGGLDPLAPYPKHAPLV
jgi:hypothetical protein